MPDSLRVLITNPTATKVIGCALRVHRALGPGLFESIYEQCLAFELAEDGLAFERQVKLPVSYRGCRLEMSFTADFIVESCVLVELKSVERLLPIHGAQVLTYLRVSGLGKGLLINFNTRLLRNGIKSFVL